MFPLFFAYSLTATPIAETTNAAAMMDAARSQTRPLVNSDLSLQGHHLKRRNQSHGKKYYHENMPRAPQQSQRLASLQEDRIFGMAEWRNAKAHNYIDACKLKAAVPLNSRIAHCL